MRMRMGTIDVGLRLGDAIDPFQLANGFEAVIGYECQDRLSAAAVCVFITAGPITKLCAWGRRIVEDMCYEIRRAEACVD